MRAKWRKAIWAVLALQLLLWHVLLLEKSVRLDYFVNRIVDRLGLPYLCYLHWKRLAVVIWLLLAVLIMALHDWSYVRFRRRCINRLSMVSETEVRESLAAAVMETGLHGGRSERSFLYRSKEAREPFLIGFRKPILIVPDREYRAQVLHFIFLHECTHMRHRDMLYKLFMLFMQSLLWFQPLMYLIKAVSYRDVEVACDEAVVAGKDLSDREEYAHALLECIKMGKVKGQAYSTYFNIMGNSCVYSRVREANLANELCSFFYHGKQMMKARISAIMREDKRWDVTAYCAIGILLLEAALSLYRIGGGFYESYLAGREAEMAETSIYEGYSLPESFTQTAIDEMIKLEPVSEDAYFLERNREDVYEWKEYAELPYEAEGPWQVRLQDADHYGDAVPMLLQRYVLYFEDQSKAAWQSGEDSWYTVAEPVYSRLLAGDREEAVFAVICKYAIGYEESELAKFPQELKDRAQIAHEKSGYYAYFDWTLRIRMVQDYVFEVEGIAKTEDVLQAYTERYAQADFSDMPKVDLVYSIDNRPVLAGMNENAYQIDTSGDVLQVSGGDGVWREVPVTLEELFERGDEMEGELTSLQPGSYQVDEKKIIFAYGGDSKVPFSVVFYDEESRSFQKSVVTTKFFGGRKLFIDFPENGQEGFLIITGERVVRDEMTFLFCTEDGGRSWQYSGVVPDMLREGHLLTTDAVFLNNRIGFMTMQGSEEPDIWRTQDGGKTWELQMLTDVPQYYTQAYAPQMRDGILCLYIGMEEYSEYGGTKAKYESVDEGRTWEYKGLVIRK